jgi:hypothetical protein
MKTRIALLLLLLLFAFIAPAQTGWQVVGNPGTGTNGEVRVFLNDTTDQLLYMGGHFTRTGSFPVSNIVRWDSLGYHALGLGCNARVDCFCIDSLNNRLYLAGTFTLANGQPTYGMGFISNGVLYPFALPYALNGDIKSMTMYNGNLIIGGMFGNIGRRMACWNGSVWSNNFQLPATTFGDVYRVKVVNGILYAGGDFSDATLSYQGLVQWNGSTWIGVGGPFAFSSSAPVYDVEMYNGLLYACGGFISINNNSSSAYKIAVLTGNTWGPVGPNTQFQGTMYRMQLYHGKLYVVELGCGSCNPIRPSNVYSWNGTTWTLIGGNFKMDVNAITIHNDQLIAGGDMYICGPDSVHRLVKLDTTSWIWSDVDGGLGLNTVFDVASFQGNVYAGGAFSYTAGKFINHIATWNDTNYTALDVGMNNDVVALTRYNNSIIAGGLFSTAGGQSCGYVAGWNGISWYPIGTGMNFPVGALINYRDTLVAGGSFFTADNNPAMYVAYLDTNGWQQMGSGFDGAVLCLGTYNGSLYAGGIFSMSGTTSVNYLARWNGSDWEAVGSNNLNDDVVSLQEFNGELYIGGRFLLPYKHVTRWNGSTFQPLANGINTGTVNTFTIHNNLLYLGGGFVNVNGNSIPSKYIAQWTGTGWVSVYTGMNASVSALADYQGDLYAGGSFTQASNASMTYIAKYGQLTTAVPLTGFTSSGTGVIVYPNPGEGLFYVDMVSDQKDMYLEVYDVLGKRIVGPISFYGKSIIDLSDSPAAVYYCRLYSGSGSVVFPIIKK